VSVVWNPISQAAGRRRSLGTTHATDNAADRRNGEQWERAFCQLAVRFGKVLSPHQIASPDKPAAAYGLGTNGRWKHYILPDVHLVYSW
jgi:hypothetical protein